MLTKYINQSKIPVLPKSEFNMYPKASDRNFWDNISEELYKNLVSEGEKYLDFDYPVLKMSDFMKFTTEGDRTPYQTPYFARRDALYALTLAECAENKGRFINDIINGIYLICDEISWVIPPHNYIDIRYGTHDGNNTALLPKDNSIVIELAGCTTAQLFSVIYTLLSDKLLPEVTERMERKIDERIITPYENHDEYFWKTEINNWNITCNYGCLMAAMITLSDDKRRENFLKKVLSSINVYYSAFPSDGGCEEGSSYWGGSSAEFYLAASLIKYVTGGSVNLLKEQKTINMATYPEKMHVVDNKFINYADASFISTLSYSLLYGFGKAVGNKSLMALGKIMKDKNPVCKTIEDAICFDEAGKCTCEISYENEYYYPDLQVMVLREDNVIFSAKGGHNNESHNHCDVGSFTLFKNGMPVVCDPGFRLYTAVTFTPDRYTLWQNNSKHHNLPLIDGKMQKWGERYNGKPLSIAELNAPAYGAENVKYENDKFSLDIAPCYGDDNIKKWQRTFEFDRKNGEISVTEEYKLSKESDIELTFMLPEMPKISEGEITLAEGVKLKYENLEANCEAVEKLYRLTLNTKGKEGKIKYTFEELL